MSEQIADLEIISEGLLKYRVNVTGYLKTLLIYYKSLADSTQLRVIIYYSDLQQFLMQTKNSIICYFVSTG